MSICSCPLGTSIPSVPNAGGCPSDFGQIQKIVFQRVFKTGTTKNTFVKTGASANPITALASWTANFAADDGTKMVITPYVEAPSTDGGDPITFGGGNDTLGGITKIIGRNPVNFTCSIRQCSQDVIKGLKGLQCEGELGAYLINGEGAVLGLADEDGHYPIPIQSLFVGDLMLMGFDNPDENTLQFSFKPNWSDDAVIVTPAFNPLTDLENED